MNFFKCPLCGKIENDDDDHIGGPQGDNCTFPRELWTPLQVGHLQSAEKSFLLSKSEGSA